MKKTTRRLVTGILGICLALVMAVPAFAQTVRKEGTYNGQGYVATLTCDDEYYTCNIGSTSSYKMKTRSIGYYTISAKVYTEDGPSTLTGTYSTKIRESAEKTAYVSDGWGIWDTANANPDDTVEMQSASCVFYVNSVQQYSCEVYA